eukprot:TRINITY_DN121402_c0_g1_i2.p2 TRINITY_DN121402_c0_g1~~TRINITY_DN121402_c0_g1_i2.p2  ORF type:complete len:303 (+),score=116.07 TRINITY_DN121402_c0_g1_i2:118-1026(+)
MGVCASQPCITGDVMVEAKEAAGAGEPFQVYDGQAAVDKSVVSSLSTGNFEPEEEPHNASQDGANDAAAAPTALSSGRKQEEVSGGEASQPSGEQDGSKTAGDVGEEAADGAADIVSEEVLSDRDLPGGEGFVSQQGEDAENIDAADEAAVAAQRAEDAKAAAREKARAAATAKARQEARARASTLASRSSNSMRKTASQPNDAAAVSRSSQRDGEGEVERGFRLAEERKRREDERRKAEEERTQKIEEAKKKAAEQAQTKMKEDKNHIQAQEAKKATRLSMAKGKPGGPMGAARKSRLKGR